MMVFELDLTSYLLRFMLSVIFDCIRSTQVSRHMSVLFDMLRTLGREIYEECFALSLPRVRKPDQSDSPRC